MIFAFLRWSGTDPSVSLRCPWTEIENPIVVEGCIRVRVYTRRRWESLGGCWTLVIERGQFLLVTGSRAAPSNTPFCGGKHALCVIQYGSH